MANYRRRGFQFWGPKYGTDGIVQPVVVPIISSKPDTYNLYPGDPVKWVTGSTSTPAYVTHSAPTEGIFGVVADIVQYRNSDGVVVRNGRYLPADTTWTADADRTLVSVWPAESCLFVVDSTTAATSIGYARGYVGKNVAHLAIATADAAATAALGLSGQGVDITASATTNTLDWRVIDVLDQIGNDVTATYGRFIVCANLLSNKAGLTAILGV